MKRYWLSTFATSIAVTVDESNTVTGESIEREYVGKSLDEVLDNLREEGQVEMMEI